jgi:acetyl-CoA C-acetyltransferase
MNPTWITDLGTSADKYWMGDKMGPNPDINHGDADALQDATRKAYEMAVIADPKSEIDIAEIYSPFMCIDVASLVAIDLCEPGEGATTAREGDSVETTI